MHAPERACAVAAEPVEVPPRADARLPQQQLHGLGVAVGGREEERGGAVRVCVCVLYVFVCVCVCGLVEESCGLALKEARSSQPTHTPRNTHSLFLTHPS